MLRAGTPIARYGLLLLCLGLVLAGCGDRNGFSGSATTLDGRPAPDITLSDATGQPFTLVGDRGQVVILTFLYTHCPDVYPLIAGKLHTTLQPFGSDAGNIRVVAASVDPIGYTPASIARLSAKNSSRTRHRTTGVSIE